MLAGARRDGDDAEPLGEIGADESFRVESDLFDGDTVREAFTCDGADEAPPVSWQRPDGEVDEYALVLSDPDAPGGTFIHWVVWGIPSDTRSLTDATTAVEGATDFGKPGYGGPCPPESDDPHLRTYRLRD